MMDGKYIYIDIVDTAILCNLEIRQSTLHDEEVQARCPYCHDYKYRMPLCEEYRPFSWPVEQKGIDDWLLFRKLKQEHGLALTN